MAQVAVSFFLDEKIKTEMERVCAEMGLDIGAAFALFAAKVAKERCIPFDISAEPACGKESIPYLEHKQKTVEIQKATLWDLIYNSPPL